MNEKNLAGGSLTSTQHDKHGRWQQAETVEDFQRNLAAVHERIHAACARAGRAPESVRLLPVSKTVDEARIRLSYQAGCRFQIGRAPPALCFRPESDSLPGKTGECAPHPPFC